MPDSDAKRLIRPTGEYCFVTAGWRREASYPAYGEYCFVTAGWRREASYPAYGRVLFVGRISASAIRHFL
ncbi:hypothetical protein DU940_05720 [Salmonella enterica subsp. enterica serovar Durham]|uniref:Uncharacterized protein n=1 Tax=Salmonella enterica subsp. enterica serovar Durham TaxID=1954178 RepID=A0A5H5M198_SALET|nr:hypothetical protein [Salmonella enterica subsp. enterica serovar Durham]EAT2665902.1 hypothetical protein [Salmonella enterica]ECH9539918.1 hypothetical protein [Salmonella enterica subsp. enterica]EAA3733178.1 hypothetical protein [Salmonella enterica subsp. enterica serovar Durham]EAA5565812.1 hypothetical protein [Salmonella enterica subsp. enterica serovar Durham]